MSYNPYMQVGDNSDFSASGTTLFDKNSHDVGVPKDDPEVGYHPVPVRENFEYAESFKNATTTKDIPRTPEQLSLDDNLSLTSPDWYREERYRPVPLVHEEVRENFEYAEPFKNATSTKDIRRTPEQLALLNQHIENKKRGIGLQRRPFVVYILTIAMVCVLIYELVLNSRQQGSPISLKPVVNPMLGPSSSALINVGARFPACMKLVEEIPPTTLLGCMNNTANPATSVCTVEEICGFGGFHNETPNQWFRFITPIFIHAGIIHIVLNMIAQLTISAQVEREMGSGGFIITYFAAGIFGNVLGGNFALVGIPSVGASGAIFGTAAVAWVDLVAHWKYHYQPVKRLIFMSIELVIGIAIGFIPYIDNFAHIGGFVMGLLVGTVLYPVISVTKRHRLLRWMFRLAAIPLVVLLFVGLIRNFYTTNPYAACSGCRYLSCIPLPLNNHCQGTGLTTTTGSI